MRGRGKEKVLFAVREEKGVPPWVRSALRANASGRQASLTSCQNVEILPYWKEATSLSPPSTSELPGLFLKPLRRPAQQAAPGMLLRAVASIRSGSPVPSSYPRYTSDQAQEGHVPDSPSRESSAVM